jgi:hypothetical protein
VCTGFWLGSLRERDHWGDPDVDGRIILRWIFRKWEGFVGTGRTEEVCRLRSLHTSPHQTTRKTNACYAAALPRSPRMKTRI